MKRYGMLLLLLAGVSGTAWAQTSSETPPAEAVKAAVDFADTAFILISSALVLLMTPALAFFYGGLSRNRSVLNTMMMSFAAIGVVTLVWVVLGYSLAFGDESMGPWLGSFQNLMLAGMDSSSTAATFNPEHLIPKYVFVMFQATFAVIAAALISGALVDRMKFGAYLAFIALWSVFVYSPVAHWVWDASGWLFTLGALDFAGGTVVHINAGVSALVAAKLLGPRLQTIRNNAIPHNIPFVLLGAGLLWFGWFGFNAGSALGANGSAGLAMLTTQIATATAMLVWLIWERATGHAMSAVGAATGAVVGLVAITPAAGIISPAYAILLGAIGATASFWAVQNKRRFKVDDVLDVFACHGVAGIVGAILTGAFAFSTGQGKGTLEQIKIQCVGVGATILYAAVGTFVILKLIALFGGLRLSKDEEMEGVDIVCHEESAYTAK